MSRPAQRPRLLLAFAVVLSVVLLFPGAGAAEEASRSARVTYFTGSTVYLDAGHAEGLRPGLELVLMRGEAVVAVVEVKDVSTHRASCTVVERTLEPEVGDEVRFSPVIDAPEADAAAGAAAGAIVAGTDPTPRRSRSGPRGAGIRGRVGVRYLLLDDHLNDNGGYSQPALDLRLDGANLGGTAWGFSVDARARRLYRDLADGSSDEESRTRLYRLAAMRRGVQDRWDVTIGRQFSPAFAAVSIFDGVSADYRGQRWVAGAFSGTQPDPLNYAYSDQIREHGAYFQYHGRPSAGRSWQVSTGLIASYDESEVNREFLYLQGRYNDRKLAVYLAQEIDFNRDWKEEEGEDTISPTSTFINLRYQVSRRFELHTGYDNRRNVRLYRDRITPITEFDDSFRRGVWAGASYYLFERYRFGVDARTNGGGDAGDSDTYGFLFSANRLSRANLDVGLRLAHYTNDFVEGQLAAATFGFSPVRRLYFQLHGGLRDEENLQLVPAENTLSWFGLEFEVDLGRHWFLLLSVERTDGDFEEIDQYYTTVSYRF